MLFAHDTEVALAAAAALVNTGRGDHELLPDLAALDQFVLDWGWTGERTHDQAELAAVLALRPRLERVWELAEDDAADLVNALLRESSALPQLVKHDSWGYHLHATQPDAPLARLQRMTPMATIVQRDMRSASQPKIGAVSMYETIKAIARVPISACSALK